MDWEIRATFFLLLHAAILQPNSISDSKSQNLRTSKIHRGQKNVKKTWSLCEKYVTLPRKKMKGGRLIGCKTLIINAY